MKRARRQAIEEPTKPEALIQKILSTSKDETGDFSEYCRAQVADAQELTIPVIER